MSADNPTPEGGASVTERIERYLAASDSNEVQDAPAQEPAAETPETQAVEAPEGDEPEQSSETQLSLSDVAKILGVDETALDVDEDGSLKVKTKVDGKEGAAKFNELLKSYQLQGHIDAKAREAAEMHRQAAERVQQFEVYAQQKAQEFGLIFNQAQALFAEEFGGINWDDLAKNDPIGYVEKQHAYNAKMQKLQQIGQAAQHQANQFQAIQQQRYQQRLASEAQRLSTLVPEWADEKTATSEKQAIAQWLHANGAAPETIAAIDSSVFADAGLIKALRIGMLAQTSKGKAEAIQKKVLSAPKLVKSGQPVDSRQRQAESVKDLKEKIRRSGGKGGSVADYLLATGRV